MPWYEFESRGIRAKVRSSYEDADILLTALYADGWRQVYTPGRAIVQLSYYEALEETDAELALADRGLGPLVGMPSKED